MGLLLALGTAVKAEPAYNELRQKSSHNSYQRSETLLDQLVFHRIRSVELDIHNGRSGAPRLTGNWYVYHADLISSGTSCLRLSDCLDALRAFHDANPKHEVVTVWLDVKDAFKAGHTPEQLDARVTQHLPAQWLFKPSDLMAACPGATSLQAAVKGACHWPSSADLRGRFIIALTGGDAAPRGRLDTYVAQGTQAAGRVGFIAPSLASAANISARPYALFFNLKSAKAALAASVHDAGFISRVWGVNSAAAWARAVASEANHIATDMVNAGKGNWAVTSNGHGWPFGCMKPGACDGYEEPADVIAAEVDSGDIWGGRDSFVFAGEENTSTAMTTWTAEVNTPDSHVDGYAKGCLMVRVSTAPEASNFAVCRPASGKRLRIQYRATAGGPTTSVELEELPEHTIDATSLTFLRLTLLNEGGETCALGYGSADGAAWHLIGSHCFTERLRYQGLAVSSRGSGPVKLLFTDVKRDSTLYREESFPVQVAVGSGVRQWRLADGVTLSGTR